MIGMTPAEMDACTLWEFTSALMGWTKAHRTDEEDKAPAMTDDRLKELGIIGFN